MKCYKCSKIMVFTKRMKFNEYEIDGWKCSCGEIYYVPEQAQRVLLLNKLKKINYHLKLNEVKSNLILRIPKEISFVLGLKNGDELNLKLKDKGKLVLSTLN